MVKKQVVVSVGLVVLGVAMLVIGGVAGLVPPALTGVGFLLLAWGQYPGRSGA